MSYPLIQSSALNQSLSYVPMAGNQQQQQQQQQALSFAGQQTQAQGAGAVSKSGDGMFVKALGIAAAMVSAVALRKTSIAKKAFKAVGQEANFSWKDSFKQNLNVFRKGWWTGGATAQQAQKLKNLKNYTELNVDGAKNVFKNTKTGKIVHIQDGRVNRLSSKSATEEVAKRYNNAYGKQLPTYTENGKLTKAGKEKFLETTEQKLAPMLNKSQAKKYTKYKDLSAARKTAEAELQTAKDMGVSGKELQKLESKAQNAITAHIKYAKKNEGDLSAIFAKRKQAKQKAMQELKINPKKVETKAQNVETKPPASPTNPNKSVEDRLAKDNETLKQLQAELAKYNKGTQDYQKIATEIGKVQASIKAAKAQLGVPAKEFTTHSSK